MLLEVCTVLFYHLYIGGFFMFTLQENWAIYFSAFIVDRDILGENGDTSLSLQLIIIED